MKNIYENFRKNLLETRRSMSLNYFGQQYQISHDDIEDHDDRNWYFYALGKSSDKQTFIECEDLLDNAKIDGKLLCEIWDDIARSMGSKVIIALALVCRNLDIENVTGKIGLQPTKTNTSWVYAAFGEEKYDDLRVYDKTNEFAKIMDGKEDIINEIVAESKYNTITPVLYIIGNPYNYDDYFGLSQNFFDLAYKINAHVQFCSEYDYIERNFV